ncbi:MAG: pyridine nucleotide-disulfide oxidoreductase/dicluster-binding protein [Lentihominibacter sp.]
MNTNVPNLNEYLKKVDNCLQHEASFCTAACPFNLDVNELVSRLQEGRFNAAYKIYRDATGFPELAARLCTESCRASCLKNAVRGGQPIELLKLERSILEHATRKEPVNYNIPAKNKSIAIIGAGISGMACALRMATKKYRVTVYEKTDRVGGNLSDSISPEVMADELALQMKHLNYNLKLNTEITSLHQVLDLGYEDNKAAADDAASGAASVMRASSMNASRSLEGTYDAVYVATGAEGNFFGIEPSAEYGGPCRIVDKTAVFLGGAAAGSDPIHALADGLRVSTAIDNYTMTGVLKYPVYPATEISIDEAAFVTTQAVVSSDEIYSKEEAVEEAGRCMKCQCSACRLHCDLTDYLHKWPLRLRDEIVATTAPGTSELHATPAIRLINTCTHCGLCRETCPEDIDMDGMILASRYRMHQLDRMPWAFNDFFLRDMEFTNGPEAAMCEAPKGYEGKSKYLFFPGCQLGASDPLIVHKSYKYLMEHEPSTAIVLGCCGVPAEWAGDAELRDSVIDRIRENWVSLGKPVMVLACPTCRNTFAKYLPEAETVFIYELMDEWGIIGLPGCRDDDSACEQYGGSVSGAFSVFDPCATRPEESVRTAVRNLCGKMGISLEPLPLQEKWTACCSYGGHGRLADPDFTKFVREKRLSESNLPYITYCINCRVSFMEEGRMAPHLLNIVFGIEPKLYTCSKRRLNRTELKSALLREFRGESSIGDERDVPAEAPAIVLEMSEDIRQKLHREFILEDEAAQVVAFCERTGRSLYDSESDSHTGYRKIGNMTYWVEYRKTREPGRYVLLNAYSHRMTIELEMVWNGKKIDIDM